MLLSESHSSFYIFINSKEAKIFLAWVLALLTLATIFIINELTMDSLLADTKNVSLKIQLPLLGKEKTRIGKLEYVNKVVNNRFKSDSTTKVMIKYLLLKKLRFEYAKFRVFYVVNKKLAKPHVVLGYYTSQNKLLILDDLSNKVSDAVDKKELTTVYSFSADSFTTKHLLFNRLADKIELSFSY